MFREKILNVMAGGAVGVVFISPLATRMATPAADDATGLNIPAVMVNAGDGAKLKAGLVSGVAMTMKVPPQTYHSTALDNTELIRNYGIAVANRLIGNGDGCLDEEQAKGTG